MGVLVVVDEVAVGHERQVLAVAVPARVRRHERVCTRRGKHVRAWRRRPAAAMAPRHAAGLETAMKRSSKALCRQPV